MPILCARYRNVQLKNYDRKDAFLHGLIRGTKIKQLYKYF